MLEKFKGFFGFPCEKPEPEAVPVNHLDCSLKIGVFEFDIRNILAQSSFAYGEFQLVESFYNADKKERYYFINFRLLGLNNDDWVTIRVLFDSDYEYARDYAQEIYEYITKII